MCGIFSCSRCFELYRITAVSESPDHFSVKAFTVVLTLMFKDWAPIVNTTVNALTEKWAGISLTVVVISNTGRQVALQYFFIQGGKSLGPM